MGDNEINQNLSTSINNIYNSFMDTLSYPHLSQDFWSIGRFTGVHVRDVVNGVKILTMHLLVALTCVVCVLGVGERVRWNS